MLQFLRLYYTRQDWSVSARNAPTLRQNHPMEPNSEFRKQIKDALEHLYDTAYLETHPLLSQFSSEALDSRLTRAQRLRGLLKETIESLRPQEGAPTGSPEWRSYLALRHRYVQGMSTGEAEIELGISLRQLQRELHKGLDAVAVRLWEKRTTPPAGRSAEAPDLENELNRWEISRQNCDVRALVDDTLWMLKPLASERGVTIQVDLPAVLLPVWVDATLTRQALFKVLRALVQSMGQGKITLEARAEQQKLMLIIESSVGEELENDTDWQSAQLISQQQGVILTVQTPADETRTIHLELPLAAQLRVLVIDDNLAIHQLFERYLAPHHYQVIHALNGQDGLQLSVDQLPDAITLDVMMPNVDGWQVLRRLTDNAATSHIPVIICSVLKEPGLAFSLGARAYIKKPVDRLELVATLARLLSPGDPSVAASRSAPEGS